MPFGFPRLRDPSASAPSYYGLAVSLGIAFSVTLLALAWHQVLEDEERAFQLEVAALEENVRTGARSADAALPVLARLASFADSRRALNRFRALCDETLAEFPQLRSAAWYAAAPGGDGLLVRAQCGAAIQWPASMSASALPFQETRQEGHPNHPLHLGSEFPGQGAYLLAHDILDRRALASALPGRLLLLVDAESLLGPASTHSRLDAGLLLEVEGVGGRRRIAGKNVQPGGNPLLGTLTRESVVRFAHYGLRMITRRELGPSDLDPGFLVTASILGLGVTLLMVALARTRNLQLRELSDRNQLITEQVDAQTRELEAARDEAFRAAKAKTDFLASMSHEIRTPLNAILGATEILTDTPLNDEQRHYLSLCRHAGESLLSLVNDVLDLSKIEAGHMTLEGVNFDAWALFEKAVELQAIRAAGKGLELVVDISPRLPTALVGDPVRLGQVLVNLLGNAVKFTAAGEVCLKVSLREGEGGGLLRISVTDTGIGIPSEAQGSIFESFTQGDSSTTRRYGGTGLGLTISRELVALMHGRLWVESEVGQGSRFHLELPLHLPPGAAREPPGLVGRRIVLLESHAGQRRVLSRLLRSEGADVLELQSVADLGDGIQGIGIPDLVLCAVRAPDTGAFDACAALCDSGVPAERIVMMLSALGGEDFARCAELGLRSLVRPVRRAPLLAFSTSKGEVLPSTGLPSSPEPLLHGSKTVSEARVGATPPVAHPRVLLVEDNEDNRSLIRRYLRDQPYEVTEACDGAEAVEAVAQEEYAVILMDIQMPVMDGHEATGRIRTFERNVGRRPSLIVALTAHALPAEQAGIVAAGCDACLTKPIKKQTLLEFLAVQVNTEPGSSQAVSSRQTAS